MVLAKVGRTYILHEGHNSPHAETPERASADMLRMTSSNSLHSKWGQWTISIGSVCEFIRNAEVGHLGMAGHACDPSTLGGQKVDHLRSGVQEQPGQHGETLSLLKIQKNQLGVVVQTCNPSYLGG